MPDIWKKKLFFRCLNWSCSLWSYESNPGNFGTTSDTLFHSVPTREWPDRVAESRDLAKLVPLTSFQSRIVKPMPQRKSTSKGSFLKQYENGKVTIAIDNSQQPNFKWLFTFSNFKFGGESMHHIYLTLYAPQISTKCSTPKFDH